MIEEHKSEIARAKNIELATDPSILSNKLRWSPIIISRINSKIHSEIMKGDDCISLIKTPKSNKQQAIQ